MKSMTRREAWDILSPIWGRKGGPVSWDDLILVAEEIKRLRALLVAEGRSPGRKKVKVERLDGGWRPLQPPF